MTHELDNYLERAREIRRKVAARAVTRFMKYAYAKKLQERLERERKERERIERERKEKERQEQERRLAEEKAQQGMARSSRQTGFKPTELDETDSIGQYESPDETDPPAYSFGTSRRDASPIRLTTNSGKFPNLRGTRMPVKQ